MLQQLGYIKQIDGLRAIAVLMVVVFHWFPRGWVTESALGLMGVDIFFVISGFLITRILLVYKYNQEAGVDKYNKWHILGRFMYRRALRIFPAYFLLLFILYQISYFLPNTLKFDWVWYVSYLQNFLFYIRQAWAVGKLSHFWTLAVEEQFYLFWPLIILFVNVRRERITILFLFLIGILSIHFLPLVLPKKQLVDILTPTCLHAFALGAIVSWMHLNKYTYLHKSTIYLIVGMSIILFSLVCHLIDINPVLDHRTLVSLGTAGIIMFILNNNHSFFGHYVLGNQVLVYIGKISYGIYLYHNFIPGYLKGIRIWLAKSHPDTWVMHYFPDINKGVVLFYTECFALLFLIAFCSYRFFEKPLLAFKNKVA